MKSKMIVEENRSHFNRGKTSRSMAHEGKTRLETEKLKTSPHYTLLIANDDKIEAPSI